MDAQTQDWQCYTLYIHISRLCSTYIPASLSSWPGSPSPTTQSRHAIAALVSWKNFPALQFHACNPNHNSLVGKKRKVVPLHAINANRGMEAYIHAFLTSAPMNMSRQLHVPAALTLRKDTPVPLRMAGWVGPRVGLDSCRKRQISCLCQEYKSWFFRHSVCSLVTIVNMVSSIS